MKKGRTVMLTAGVVAFSGAVLYRLGKKFLGKEDKNMNSAKYQRLDGYYDILTKWMELRQQGKTITSYLEKQGIHKIAIYGHGKVGILLYQDLAEEKRVEVEYFLDVLAETDFYSIGNTLVTSPARLPMEIDTDAIIVTPEWAFDRIENSLKKQQYNKPIISLNRLLYQI